MRGSTIHRPILESLGSEYDDLKPRLAELLAPADRPGLLRTNPGSGEAPWDMLGGSVDAVAGGTVGPYRLVKPIAEGGMGSVWLAERVDRTVQRPLALKLPRGTWRPGLLERMAREREVLASLNHPHIARLYDAGLTSDQHPFLVLEYVEGSAIDEYAQRAQLDTKARVRLFLPVAQAVAHAHARLVVHRDLKPSNILVTDEGEARLLDFGVAKLLDQGPAKTTELTEIAGAAITPAYASPEQIAGEPIGVASDVYSLGVLLYELVTGGRPYELAHDSRAALEEAILQISPPRPSESAADPGARRTLRGDLDTILLKALKKRPDERYATVNAFAEDLERYLDGRAVLARPDSPAYRLKKSVSRNKLAVGASVGVLVAILSGAGLALWQARVATAEKERAEEVKEFIASIFREADPYAGESGKVPTLVELLVRASTKIEQELGERPEIRVELLNLVGASLLNLQEIDAAEPVVVNAVRTARQLFGPEDPRTLQARRMLVSIHRVRGRTDEMRAELEDLIPVLRDQGSSAGLVVALKQQAHLAIDDGQFGLAESAAEEAAEMALAELGPRHPETAATAMVLAQSYRYNGKTEQAAQAASEAFHRVLALHEGNARHPQVIDARAVLGRALGDAGELERGIEELSVANRDAAEVFGESSMMVGFFSQNLVSLLLSVGEIPRALETSDRALRILSSHAEPGSHTIAAAVRMRGLSFLEARDGPAALDSLTRASSVVTAALGPDHPNTLLNRADRAIALAYVGQTDTARSEVEAVLRQARSSDDPAVLGPALHALGVVLRLAGSPRRSTPSATRSAGRYGRQPRGGTQTLVHSG